MDTNLDALRIDQENREPRVRKGVKVKLLLSLLLILAALGGIGLFALTPSLNTKKVEVAQAILQSDGGTQSLLTAGGYIVAEREATVSAKIPGVLEHLAVKINDTVRAGQVIARLESSEFQAEVNQAQTKLEVAKAQLAELLAGTRPEEIRRAEAVLKQAKANLENAEKNLLRSQELVKKGWIAVQEFDNIQTQTELARAQYKQAEENYQIARVGPRPEQIAIARAQVQQAEADLKLARARLGNMIIQSPISGTVIDQKADIGDMLFPGEREGNRPGYSRLGSLPVSTKSGSVIVTIADLSALQVEMDINETDLGKLRVGQPARITPDAFPGMVLDGKVARIYPVVDNQRKTIQVSVKIGSPEVRLRPGMSAKVTFLAEPSKDVAEKSLVVPKGALLERSGNTTVFIVQDFRAYARKVKPGTITGDYVSILEGLNPGDTVIVKGHEQLNEGEKVLILKK